MLLFLWVIASSVAQKRIIDRSFHNARVCSRAPLPKHILSRACVLDHKNWLQSISTSRRNHTILRTFRNLSKSISIAEREADAHKFEDCFGFLLQNDQFGRRSRRDSKRRMWNEESVVFAKPVSRVNIASGCRGKRDKWNEKKKSDLVYPKSLVMPVLLTLVIFLQLAYLSFSSGRFNNKQS